MAIESVVIGARVTGKEGESLGHVTRLVVDAVTGRLAYLVVDHGPLSTERLVDLVLVNQSTPDEVVLSVGGDQASQLPPFVEREIVQTRGRLTVPVGSGLVDIAGTGNTWFLVDGGGLTEYDGDSLFETAPIGTVVTDTISSVPESSLVIGKHTHVVTADGYKVGHVDALSLDDQQRVVGFVMTSGHLFKHHVRVPSTWVAGISHDRVRLTRGLDDAMDAENADNVWPA